MESIQELTPDVGEHGESSGLEKENVAMRDEVRVGGEIGGVSELKDFDFDRVELLRMWEYRRLVDSGIATVLPFRVHRSCE